MKKWKIPLILLILLLAAGCATELNSRYSRDDGPVLTWSEETSTTMTVNWLTSEERSSSLYWGTAPDSLTEEVSSPAGRIHNVTIRNLTPDTAYYYRIDEDLTLGASDRVYSFKTAPPRGERTEFVIIGDMQPFNDETKRTNRIVQNKLASLDIDFYIQMGDITETGGKADSWADLMDVLPYGASETPLLTTIGNHDYYNGGAGNFKSFFAYPYASGARSSRGWYSVDAGDVHLVFLDSMAAGAALEEQKNWLEEDLDRAAENGARWKFIFLHYPLVDTSTGHVKKRLYNWLLPVNAARGVDGVFWGHNHLYEHYDYTYGANGYVFNEGDRPAEKPTHMFCTGGGGARVDALYKGFFDHKPYRETMRTYNLDTGESETLTFEKRPWNRDNTKEGSDMIHHQNREVYPLAGIYTHHPFDSPEDFETGTYSTDPGIRYTDSAEFFGLTYGETSMHYIRIVTEEETCRISVHYYDREEGHGTVMESLFGVPQMWTLTEE